MVTSNIAFNSNLFFSGATILECMRLSSPVAIGLPSCTNRDIQLDRYTIPKGEYNYFMSNLLAKLDLKGISNFTLDQN